MSGPGAATLFLAADLHAADGTVALLARGFADAGRAVILATADPAAGELERAGVRVVELDLGGHHFLPFRAAPTRLEALVRSEDVGVVHALGDAAAAPAQRLARRSQRPWVFTPDTASFAGAGSAPPAGVAGNGAADRIVVPSQDLAERLAAEHDVAGAHLRVVPPAVDLACFDPATLSAERRRAVRAGWGVADDRPVVLVPGPVTPVRGQLDLARALKRLGRGDVVAVCAGPHPPGGAYRKQIELFARTAGMADQLVFATADDDRAAASAEAAVVALPAMTTPPAAAPAALEAQAMGTPVIVHALGALPEAVMPGATGWLVEPGDTVGLAEALDLALALPAAVRGRAAPRARAFVAEHFGTERLIAATLDVHRELARVAAW